VSTPHRQNNLLKIIPSLNNLYSKRTKSRLKNYLYQAYLPSTQRPPTQIFIMSFEIQSISIIYIYFFVDSISINIFTSATRVLVYSCWKLPRSKWKEWMTCDKCVSRMRAILFFIIISLHARNIKIIRRARKNNTPTMAKGFCFLCEMGVIWARVSLKYN
jgi:hypothetical protein